MRQHHLVLLGVVQEPTYRASDKRILRGRAIFSMLQRCHSECRALTTSEHAHIAIPTFDIAIQEFIEIIPATRHLYGLVCEDVHSRESHLVRVGHHSDARHTMNSIKAMAAPIRTSRVRLEMRIGVPGDREAATVAGLILTLSHSCKNAFVKVVGVYSSNDTVLLAFRASSHSRIIR